MDAIGQLVDVLEAMPGLTPCRGCAGYDSDPTSDDAPTRWDVAIHLDHRHGTPTTEAWRSLTLIAETTTELLIGGREVELTIGAARREGDDQAELFFSLDGAVDSIEPDEMASWLRDLQTVVA